MRRFKQLLEWFDRQAMSTESAIVPDERQVLETLKSFAAGQKMDVMDLRQACEVAKVDIHEMLRLHNRSLAEQLNLPRTA